VIGVVTDVAGWILDGPVDSLSRAARWLRVAS
jgi:hypothetical protein